MPTNLAPVRAVAPTRVDLVGGTLDIWPLNLFFPGAVTLNAALGITVEAQVAPRRDRKIVLASGDRGMSRSFPSLAAVTHNHPLGLLSRLTVHFLTAGGYGGGATVTTRSSAPAGAGLAGSSALNIALCHALATATGMKKNRRELIDIAKDVEAALLGIPTGLQDYGAATWGGVSAFHFPAGGMEREALPDAGALLADRLLLFYSGQSRNSGINNWEMFRRVVDGDRRVTARFTAITECAIRGVEALRAGDAERFAAAVDDEWKARRSLFPGISTPVIDGAVRAGRRAGAKAARICGAGGGGCFFLLAPPERHDLVRDAVAATGAAPLPFTLRRSGVVIYR